MSNEVAKDALLKRLEALNAEVEVYAADHTKVTKILKDLETKIIFTKGKIAEMSSLIQSLEPVAENSKDVEGE